MAAYDNHFVLGELHKKQGNDASYIYIPKYYRERKNMTFYHKIRIKSKKFFILHTLAVVVN